jgi:hypothetical protein
LDLFIELFASTVRWGVIDFKFLDSRLSISAPLCDLYASAVKKSSSSSSPSKFKI